VVLAPPGALDPQRHDVLVVGPGLGGAAAAALQAAEAFPGVVIVDADAILPLREASAALRGRVVLTPHSAEAAALLGLRRARVEADRLDALRQLRAFGLPVLKGPGSLIGDRVPACWPVADGRLAVAGAGDVLAGLIGGLVARCSPRGGEALGAVVSAAVGLHAHAAAALPPGGRAGQLGQAIAAAWERHAPAAGPQADAPAARG
jgi:NAD(P)H-hydrate repair Nnr-like enzyme with NAD(P)H-hydrate dehydratase domain